MARLLSAQKFTVTVRATLQWLAQKSVSLDVLKNLEDDTVPIDPVLTDSSLADSTSTVQEAYPTGAPPASRKRKRNGTIEAPVPQTPEHIVRLYTSICCNLIQLQEIAGDKSRGYAVEHLQAALRSPPEDAAAILGCSARVIDYLVRNKDPISTSDYNDAWLLPMVQHWRSQIIYPEYDLNLPASVSSSMCSSLYRVLITREGCFCQTLSFPNTPSGMDIQ